MVYINVKYGDKGGSSAVVLFPPLRRMHQRWPRDKTLMVILHHFLLNYGLTSMYGSSRVLPLHQSRPYLIATLIWWNFSGTWTTKVVGSILIIATKYLFNLIPARRRRVYCNYWGTEACAWLAKRSSTWICSSTWCWTAQQSVDFFEIFLTGIPTQHNVVLLLYVIWGPKFFVLPRRVFGGVVDALGCVNTTLEVVVTNCYICDRILFNENIFFLCLVRVNNDCVVVGIMRWLMHRWKALVLLFSVDITTSFEKF